MPTPKNKAPISFTKSLDQLNAVVERFRTETLPLEEALSLFEVGVTAVGQCQQTLGQAKGRLQVLSQTLENGPWQLSELESDTEPES